MRALLAATAVAGSLLVAVPAQAHPNYHYEGGCFLHVTKRLLSSRWEGVGGSYVTATDAAGVPAAVWIAVECRLYRNAVYQFTFGEASGLGHAGTVEQVEFEADDNDVITICDVVTVGGEAHTRCGNARTTNHVPQPVDDLVDAALVFADTATCIVLKELAPFVPPGVVEITPEGDVYVAGELFWDCPPYYSGGPGIDVGGGVMTYP